MDVKQCKKDVKKPIAFRLRSDYVQIAFRLRSIAFKLHQYYANLAQKKPHILDFFGASQDFSEI